MCAWFWCSASGPARCSSSYWPARRCRTSCDPNSMPSSLFVSSPPSSSAVLDSLLLARIDVAVVFVADDDTVPVSISPGLCFSCRSKILLSSFRILCVMPAIMTKDSNIPETMSVVFSSIDLKSSLVDDSFFLLPMSAPALAPINT